MHTYTYLTHIRVHLCAYPHVYTSVYVHTHTAWEDCNRGLGLSSAHFTSISFGFSNLIMLAAQKAPLHTRTQKEGCFPHEYWHPRSESFLRLANTCRCGQRSVRGLWCAGCEERRFHCLRHRPPRNIMMTLRFPHRGCTVVCAGKV